MLQKTRDFVASHWRAITAGVVTAAVGTFATIALFAATTNTAVDFTKQTQVLANKAFSGSVSTFGDGLTKSAVHRSAVASLGLGMYRVPIQWNNGNPISSAGSGPKDISGDAWISNIKAVGAEPVLVVGGTHDVNFSAQDAANLVTYFNKTKNNRVNYWVVGNEPSNPGSDMNIQQYCTLFNNSYDAMKAVDPTIKIAGPAWAYYDANNIRDFLNCAGSKVDIVDFHFYAMGESYLSTDTALSRTKEWEDKVKETRQIIDQIAPNRSNQIEIQVGEYNWSFISANGYPGRNFDEPDKQGDDRMYQSTSTVWGASVAGHIAAAGGRGHMYADLNGGLGMTFEKPLAADYYGKKLSDPMPIYHGLRMFSGGDLFRGFGTSMVQASTSLPNVEVFASNNNKNIVLINKNPATTHLASIQLNGFSKGTADIWQTNKDTPFDAPQRKAILNITNKVEYDLPPYSVTTMVLNENTSAPTPTPDPTPTPPPAPTPSPTPTPAPTPPAPTPAPQPTPPTSYTVPLRINAGGGEYTDPSGNKWRADVGFSAGNTNNQAVGKAIAKTNAAQVYQDERWGAFEYQLPMANGTYKVRLHFAEIYASCQTKGCRVFNVTAEGGAWLTNYDIAAKSGGYTATVEEKLVTVSDGVLNVALSAVTGSPQLAGIEVLAADTAAPAPTPTPPASGATGLQATYYNSLDLTSKGITRTDPNIDFNWGTASPITGIPADKFSVRWTGQITPTVSDTYTFYLTGDDGVRMWVDDKQIIGGWRDQSSREYSGKITLTGGKSYNIRVEYYENYGDAVAKLAWSTASMSRQAVPSKVLSPKPTAGLAVTFYNYNGGGVFGSVIHTTSTTNINFNWGTRAPAVQVPTDRYGVTWSGTITAPATGNYTFTTISDDGTKLTINDQVVVDAWSDHSARQDKGTIALTAGKQYTFNLSYYENYGDAVMKLLWSVPGQTPNILVPADAFNQN